MKVRHRESWLGPIWLAGLLLLLLLVLGRCWQLQRYHQRDCRRRARRQQLKIIPQTARRGLIVDRQGRTLALSTPVMSVALDPSLLTDPNATADALARTLRLDPLILRRRLARARGQEFLWVKRFVTDAQARATRELGLAGVILVPQYRRRYPMGKLAAHVIGYTDIDGRGLEGVEQQYEHILAGRPGRLPVRIDVARRPLGQLGPLEAPRDGRTVVLTIDAVIQTVLEEQLRQVVRKFHAAGAVGIVMEPRTGQVYALANCPAFDPAAARSTDPDLRRNRALTDPVEPGSTFKPFTVAAALQGGFVTVDQTIYCHDGRYSGRGFGTIREYGRHRYGNLTVAEIIAHSSNIGAAIIAQKMGQRHFYRMIERFGFGRKTGIDLPGEGAGILRPLAQWKWGQYALTRAAYGQGPIAVTPIQLIRAFCCLANGGRLVTPRVVRGVLDQDGTVVRDLVREQQLYPLRVPGDPPGDPRVISPQVARQMVRDVLVGVVTRPGGTAHNAFLQGYQVFGKTGTAQVPRKDGRGYEPDKYVSSFIAGAPAPDPRLCVLVMVREPDRSLGLGYTGGVVAAPAVREILRQALAYLHIPPTTAATASTATPTAPTTPTATVTAATSTATATAQRLLGTAPCRRQRHYKTIRTLQLQRPEL